MVDANDVVTTGSDLLDRMLDGGLPKRRATLVTGGPGTGKSTLGMQFLQAGLDVGESGIYISTEQTIDEIKQSFSEFAFDFDDPNLTLTSIHAAPGQTIEQEDALTLETFEKDDSPLGEYGIPFTPEYIKDHVKEHGPADRIVFDSTSGLEALADDPARYRRIILDLIRFFSDELDATTIFTAEEHRTANAETELLEFTTHGVLRLFYTDVDSDRHRSLEILKMRGADHDHRRVEVQITEEGLRLGPHRRSQPPELKTHAHQPIGIPGLDSLTGGGLVTGSGVLLEHDGKINLNALLGQLLTFGLQSDRTVLLVPTIELRETQIEHAITLESADLETMLADDRLIVIDPIGSWDDSLPNVHTAPTDVEEFMSLIAETVETQCAGNFFGIINTDAIVHSFGTDGARRVRHFTEAQLLAESDMLVDILNPNVVADVSSEFYKDAAEQVLNVWSTEEGLQYVTLEKSPCGFVGTTSLIEYRNTPPYLRVQEPPQTRTNPYAVDSE